MKRATGGGTIPPPLIIISIHALVKRATSDPRPVGAGRGHFNPRPREEGDLALGVVENKNKDFNPRPREEGDKIESFGSRPSGHFNPRPREEGDQFSQRHVII